LGAVLYISGIYTSFFGQATLVVPIVLGVYAALFVGVIVYDRMSWTRIVIDEGLTVLDERLMTLLKRHVEAEKRSKKLESLIDEVEYAPIKLLLLNIMLDTEKHEKLARSIVRTLSGEVKVPSSEGYRRQVEAARGAFQAHVGIEAEMVRLVGEEVRTAKSRVVRSLLGAVLEEERAHHKVFSSLLGKTT